MLWHEYFVTVFCYINSYSRQNNVIWKLNYISETYMKCVEMFQQCKVQNTFLKQYPLISLNEKYSIKLHCTVVGSFHWSENATIVYLLNAEYDDIWKSSYINDISGLTNFKLVIHGAKNTMNSIRFLFMPIFPFTS